MTLEIHRLQRLYVAYSFKDQNSITYFLEDWLVQEDLADLLPQVEQANDISQELDKKVKQFLNSAPL